MADIVWIHPLKGSFIIINDTLIKKLEAYKQKGWGTPESGGYLLGTLHAPHFIIEDYTFPMVGDIRTRCSFQMKDKGHYLKARSIWDTSDGYSGVIGQWHTHPEQLPAPSQIDQLNGIKLEKAQKADMVQLIIGLKEHWCGQLSLKGKVQYLRYNK